MKAKFKVSHDEMTIYKDAHRRKLPVTMKGVEGKHVMNNLNVKPVNDDLFELSIEYGKAAKRAKQPRTD